MTRTVAEKRADFRALHQQGCFVIPNPWDAGSARYLQGLGFKALATTSSGHAWSCARPDGADVGCGHGHSTVLMAKAFPKSRFWGFDVHAASIDAALEIGPQGPLAPNPADFDP